jgi:HSP20 family protein
VITTILAGIADIGIGVFLAFLLGGMNRRSNERSKIMGAVTHWDPFRGLRRRDEAFDEFVREFFTRGQSEIIEPSADVAESNGDVTVKMAIPGVEKDQIHISVDNGVLDVHGETRKETEEKKKNYHRQEIHYGAFRRTISLPTAVDVDKANATMKDGMLTITLPKSETPKGHEIKIAAA